MATHHEKPDAWLSLGLAAVGGYGDAAGFILAKTFTGHVTGNLVLAAIDLATRDWPAMISSLVAIATFLLGVILSVWTAEILKARTSRPLLPIVLGIEVFLVTAACVFLRFPTIGGVEGFVVCMSLALGLQNGAFRRAGGISVHTTYLTGTITSLIATEAEKHHSEAAFPEPAAHDTDTTLLYGIWAAFVFGAGIGAATVHRFQGFGLLGAALLLVVLILHLETGSNADLDKPRLKAE